MRAQALSRMKDVLTGKELGYVPYVIVDSKGKRVNVELKSVPIVFNGVTSVLTIMQDVTQKEVYEREKQRVKTTEVQNKKLKEEIELRQKVQNKLKQNETLLISQKEKLRVPQNHKK